MSAGGSSGARWTWAIAATACAAGLMFAARAGGPGEPATRTVYRAVPVMASADPAVGSAYAGRSRVFGLVTPGRDPGQVLFAPARRTQPAGPETVSPANVQPYQALPLAPDAEIRVTAPIDLDDLPDYVRGVAITADRFPVMYQESSQRYGPFLDRGHMFELWFDGAGRVVRMRHIFSP